MALGSVKHNLRKARKMRDHSRRVTIQVQVGRYRAVRTGTRSVYERGSYDAMACLGRRPSGFGPSNRRGGARCAHAYSTSPTGAVKKAVRKLLTKIK